jgi:hypothetical protein
MKNSFAFRAFALIIFCAFATNASAQMRGPSTGPKMDAAMAKLFGDVKAFSADVEIHAKPANHAESVMFARMYLGNGRSRMELNFADCKSGDINPQAMAQMKQMGMDRIVNIAQMDRKMLLLVYPGLGSYTEMPTQEGANSPDECNAEITKVGEETIDSHPCIKNKVVVTVPDGKKYESAIWCAKDMHGFPIRIQTTSEGSTFVMLYKNISFSTPDKSLFDAPAGYTRYANIQTMMQTEMMKRVQAGKMGGGDEEE